jgi:hypothetical protein
MELYGKRGRQGVGSDPWWRTPVLDDVVCVECAGCGEIVEVDSQLAYTIPLAMVKCGACQEDDWNDICGGGPMTVNGCE